MTGPARRRDPSEPNNKLLYTRKEFVEFYGRSCGRMWQEAGRQSSLGGDANGTIELRADPTVDRWHHSSGKLYTLSQFTQFYGPQRGLQLWQKAGKMKERTKARMTVDSGHVKPSSVAELQQRTTQALSPRTRGANIALEPPRSQKIDAPVRTDSTAGMTVSATSPVQLVQQPELLYFTPELRNLVWEETAKDLDEAEAELERVKAELALERERRVRSAEQALAAGSACTALLRTALSLERRECTDAVVQLSELRQELHVRREEARRAKWALYEAQRKEEQRAQRERAKVSSVPVSCVEAEAAELVRNGVPVQAVAEEGPMPGSGSERLLTPREEPGTEGERHTAQEDCASQEQLSDGMPELLPPLSPSSAGLVHSPTPAGAVSPKTLLAPVPPPRSTSPYQPPCLPKPRVF